jgi:SPP1 family predicted phage head-tail adaptor
MRSGLLNRRIDIQRETVAVDAAGERTVSWVTIATLRAELVTAEDTETPREPGASTDSVLTFRCRHANVGTADRVLYRGAHHDIRSIREIGHRGRDMELRCSTRALS